MTLGSFRARKGQPSASLVQQVCVRIGDNFIFAGSGPIFCLFFRRTAVTYGRDSMIKSITSTGRAANETGSSECEDCGAGS